MKFTRFRLTLIARLSTKTGITLTVTANTVSIAIAPVGTVSHHFASDNCVKSDFLVVSVIIVQRNKPEASFHEPCYVPMNRRLVCSTGSSRVKATEDLFEVILRVCWKSISPGVKTYRRSTRDGEVKFYVGFFSCKELHVPIAVRRNHSLEPLSKLNFAKLRVIRRDCSRTGQIARYGRKSFESAFDVSIFFRVLSL